MPGAGLFKGGISVSLWEQYTQKKVEIKTHFDANLRFYFFTYPESCPPRSHVHAHQAHG
jgi:hypothetical protein